MNVHTQLYNTDGVSTEDFLSVVFFLCYLCFLGIWVLVCLRNRPYVNKIHILMGALLVIVIVDLICGPPDKQYVKITHNAHGCDIIIYTLKFFRLVFFYAIIVLIGSGLFFVRRFLLVREKIIVMSVMLVNIAFIVIWEANPSDIEYENWYVDFLFADYICFISLSWPVLRTLIWLKGAAKGEGKGATSSAKIKIFEHFFLMVMIYSSLWRHVVYMVKKRIADSNAIKEILSLVFCMLTFYLFKPVKESESVEINDVDVRQPAKGKKSQTPPQTDVSFSYQLPEDFNGEASV